MRHDRITALWFIEGPIDSEAVLLYIEKFWSRPCGAATSSSWTISTRTKANAVGRAIRAAGPRSSICDILARSEPIEQFFAKFKHWLRKAA
jgi:hypothetical protein